MKFTITSITSEGVKAKTDNPVTKPYVGYPSMLSDAIQYDKWKEAEANRREYDVPNQGIFQSNEGLIAKINTWYFSKGDRIEGEIINNEIVNVKIV